MFKKLHRKVLLLNMAVTFAVLLIAFCAVYVTTLNSINAENQRRLDSVRGAISTLAHGPVIATSNGPSTTVTDYSGNLLAEFYMEAPEPYNNATEGSGDIDFGMMTAMNPTDFAPFVSSFIITVDSEGNTKNIETPYDFPREQYEQAALKAWQTGTQSTMTLFDRTWLYKIEPLVYAAPGPLGTTLTNYHDFYRIVFLDITDSIKTLQNLLMTFVFVGLGMLGVIFVVSYFFTRRAIQPVSVAWEKQRQFVADASHELKTPLATMMTNYDVVLSNEENTVASQKEWLDYFKIGMDRMNKVISNLLSLARFESGEPAGEKSLFDLSSLVTESMQQMHGMAQEKKLKVINSISDELLVMGNKDMTEQVFSILYDNALKYADEGGTVEVALQQTKKHAVCLVRNTGKGISPEDLPHIFDRFYRADTARSSEDNSHGLGLPIALAIAEQLGGSITASSKEDGWTEFAFTLGQEVRPPASTKPRASCPTPEP